VLGDGLLVFPYWMQGQEKNVRERVGWPAKENLKSETGVPSTKKTL